jgi:hypothetical protein
MLKPNFNLDNIGEYPTFTVPENIVDIHEEPNFNHEDPRIQETTRI